MTIRNNFKILQQNSITKRNVLITTPYLQKIGTKSQRRIDAGIRRSYLLPLLVKTAAVRTLIKDAVRKIKSKLE